MKKNKKIIIILLVIISLSILAVFLAKNKRKDVSVKANEQGIITYTKRGIIKDEEYDGIKYTNNSLITENNYTKFTSTAINVSKRDINNEKYHLYLKDKKGDVIGKLLIYIPGGIKKGESKTVTATIGGKFEDALTKEISD